MIEKIRNSLAVSSLLIFPLVLQGCATARLETSRFRGDQLSSQAHYSYRTGKLREALTGYQAAYREYSKVDSQPEVARAANNVATLLYHFGRNEEALQYASRATELYVSLRDSSAYARSLANRASILLELGRRGEAEDSFHKALQLLSGERAELDRARILIGLSLIRAHEGKLNESEQMATEASRIFDGSKESQGMASSRLARAVIARLRGDFLTAKELAEEALELDKANGLSVAILKDLKELGVILEFSDKKASMAYFVRALGVARSLDLISEAGKIETKIKALEQ